LTLLNHILKIASTASPYGRAKIQVSVFLQDNLELLPAGKPKKRSTLSLPSSPVQRLRWSSSPHPQPRGLSTRPDFPLHDKLGLAEEVYSMSIYSLLNPSMFADGSLTDTESTIWSQWKATRPKRRQRQPLACRRPTASSFTRTGWQTLWRKSAHQASLLIRACALAAT
jgi:hypothetical protein